MTRKFQRSCAAAKNDPQTNKTAVLAKAEGRAPPPKPPTSLGYIQRRTNDNRRPFFLRKRTLLPATLLTGHSTPVPMSKQENIDEIVALKAKIAALIANVRTTKTVCDKYENENQYLQDYIGSLMKKGEMK